MGLRHEASLQLRLDASPKSHDQEDGSPFVASVKETGCPGAGDEGEKVKSALNTVSAAIELPTAKPASRSMKRFEATAKAIPGCGKRKVPDAFRKAIFIA